MCWEGQPGMLRSCANQWRFAATIHVMGEGGGVTAVPVATGFDIDDMERCWIAIG